MWTLKITGYIYHSFSADKSPIDGHSSSTKSDLHADSDCGSNLMPRDNCHLETDPLGKVADSTNQYISYY